MKNRKIKKDKTKVVKVNNVLCEVATRGGCVSTFPIDRIPSYKATVNSQ